MEDPDNRVRGQTEDGGSIHCFVIQVFLDKLCLWITFQGKFGRSQPPRNSECESFNLSCCVFIGTQKGAGIRRDNRELESGKPEHPTGIDFISGN